MTNTQFRILYRQFLFRIVDLEILSSQADTTKLLGQFASLLLFISLLFSLPVWGVADAPARARLVALWGTSHFLIATTMLVVGLFSVLSWDSMFPDRRDVLTLAPLPIRASTLFSAKVAAVSTGLAVTVLALNAVTGVAAPFGFAPAGSGAIGITWAFAAYWLATFAAGAFIFCCIAGIQGLAALLLSRRQFLRVSSLLQMAALCLFVSVYFLEPSLAFPEALTSARSQHWLACLPSYWFSGLLQQLNGSVQPSLDALATRSWVALAVAGCATVLVYLISYFRTLRRIAEELDIVLRFRSSSWLPRFGSSLDTAVGQFSIRTLLRSRQHRLILAFYLAIGFALAIVFMNSPPAQQQLWDASANDPWRHANAPMLFSSVVIMFFAVIGTRAVFAMPLELKANWVFRIAPLGGLPECLAATRRVLVALAVAPVWLTSAAIFLGLWPWRPAAGHLLVLALLGIVIAEITLAGFHKIPFTCSYLPGKSNVNRAFWICIALVLLAVDKGAALELYALEHPMSYVILIAILAAALVLARRRTAARAQSEALLFEQLPPPVVLVLRVNDWRMGTRR